MYGGLCLIIWIEYLRQHPAIHTKRIFVGGILAPALMSGCIELLQEYGTSNRSGDWADLLANLTGVVSAALVGRYLLWPYSIKKEKEDTPTILTNSRRNDEKSSYIYCEDRGSMV